MRGAKRHAMSESAPDTNDSFQNKRLMEGSLLDVHRAKPSQKQSMTTKLDMQRAESSQQHVRALNTQFASWVQTQLKNHPNELWEDGVRDYLYHASNIMEKFSDVVDWLKAYARDAGNSSAAETNSTEKKLVSEIKNNGVKLSEQKTFTPAATTSSFATSGSFGLFSSSSAAGSSGKLSNNADSTSSGQFSFELFSSSSAAGSSGIFSNNADSRSSELFSNNATSGSSLFSNNATSGTSLASNSAASWSSGVFPNHQTPVLFGSQSSLPKNSNASNDSDNDEIPQPSSPSVKKSEEKGITVVHEVKCKLYVKSSDPADKDTWKNRGTGQLSIKCKEGVNKGTKESKPTVLIRNDVGRVVLNALLYPGIKINLQKNSVVAIFHSADEDGDSSAGAVARTFLIKTKTEEERNKLATAIQDYAPDL